MLGLSSLDWLLALLPFAATVLAVWKETTKDVNPGSAKILRGPKRLTKTGVLALMLATTGFVVAVATTSRENMASIERQRKTDDAEDLMKRINAQLQRELPGFIEAALNGSQKQINDFVDRTVAHSNRTLEKSISTTISDSGAKLDRAIGATMNVSQAELKDAVNRSIADVRLAMTKTVEDAAEKSRVSLDKTVRGVEEATKSALAEAGNAMVGEIKGAVFTAASDMVIQIPLQILDGSTRRLAGPLANLNMKVGNVSKSRPFSVSLWDGDKAVPVIDEHGQVRTSILINPKSRQLSDTHCLGVSHEGRDYRLEMIIQTPTNVLGSAPDTLITQIVPLGTTDSAVARSLADCKPAAPTIATRSPRQFWHRPAATQQPSQPRQENTNGQEN
jgi:hypothetical protein